MDKLITLFILVTSSVVNAGLPEEKLNVPELIKYWGYPVESHQVLTDDGYFLTLHRIPYGRNEFKTSKSYENVSKPVFFLQHGLLASSSNWVVNLPTQSLGFMLADAGFDVWMGNVRGNTYSKSHTSYPINSDAFWDFSFDEMAKYDLPAMVEYALGMTGQEYLYYVGHSQGTMMAFGGLSENIDLQKRIKVVFALAPVARLQHIYSPIKYLTYFTPEIKVAFHLVGVRDFLPSMKAVKTFADKVCPISEKFCDNALFLLTGYDKKNLNATRTPVYLSHTPAGTSVKDMFHFSQLIRSGKFQKYDYGWLRNIALYHSIYPDVYDVKKVETDIVLFSGSNDWLADPKDVKWLKTQLPNIISSNEIQGYNHLDFIWGINARSVIYKKIINMALNIERLKYQKL